jgi:hypothetical protein
MLLVIRYAKVRADEVTYVKHGVQVFDDGTVNVTDPRTQQVVATLPTARLERLPGSTWRADSWLIEDMGCGCRDRVTVEPNPPA